MLLEEILQTPEAVELGLGIRVGKFGSFFVTHGHLLREQLLSGGERFDSVQEVINFCSELIEKKQKERS